MMVLDMGDIPPYFGKTADLGVLPDGLVGESEVDVIDGFESLRLKKPILKLCFCEYRDAAERALYAEQLMQGRRKSH